MDVVAIVLCLVAIVFLVMFARRERKYLLHYVTVRRLDNGERIVREVWALNEKQAATTVHEMLLDEGIATATVKVRVLV